MSTNSRLRDVIIVGGGFAGLSAAVYLGRSKRDTLLIHTNRSMAKWELDVQNYLGFPHGIEGQVLLDRSLEQVNRFAVDVKEDDIHTLTVEESRFVLRSDSARYQARRVLLATGLTHVPPKIPGVRECLGRSLFFCKDCDAYRMQGKCILVIGDTNEAADYALAMLVFSAHVTICTNGQLPRWDPAHAGWLREYAVPIREESILALHHDQAGQVSECTIGGDILPLDCAFTVQGDVYHHDLARQAGAKLDDDGQIIVDHCQQTNIPGLYAAGCVTAANCQMIIAAGQGALAGQAINRNLFEDSLRRHALPRCGQQHAVELA